MRTLNLSIHRYAVQTMVNGEPDLTQTQYMASERTARDHAHLRRNYCEARVGASKTVIESGYRKNVVRVVDIATNTLIEDAR